MKKNVISFLVSLLFILPVVLLSQTTDEIITRVREVHGGEDALQAVQTLVVRGNAKNPDGTGPKVRFEMTIKYPDKFKQIYDIQLTEEKTEAIFASNGMTHWNLNPAYGVAEPTEIGDNEMLEPKHQLDFLIPFRNLKDRAVFIQKREDWKENENTYFVIRIEYKDGFFADYFIDKETFLISKRRHRHQIDSGGDTGLIYTFSDYRDVNGIKFPFEVRSSLSTMIYKIDSYEINVAVDDSIFDMPK